MAANQQRNLTSATGSKVLPFRRPGERASIPGSLPDVADYAYANETIKAYIEGAVYDAFLKAKLEQGSSMDNPFDAIYIAQLKPDVITKQDRDTLDQYKNIKDLSSEISFADGWDD